MTKSLMKKLLAVDKSAQILAESDMLDATPIIKSSVKMFNVTMGGTFDGGIGRGMHQFVGESKTFKTGFLMLMAKDFLDQNKTGVVLFFDSEAGGASIIHALRMDLKRIIHIPMMNIEDLKFKTAQFLDQVSRKDKILVLVDSIGTLPSIKEVADALSENAAVDMTRAKQLNSWSRIIAPYLSLKDIPAIVINTNYKTQETYAKDVVKGGNGSILASENIFIITKRKNTNIAENSAKATGVRADGFEFVVKSFKSRYTKEGSVLPVKISYSGGIDVNSGLYECATYLGYIKHHAQGWYIVKGQEKKIQKSGMDNKFWGSMLKNKGFTDAVENLYSLTSNSLLREDD